MNTGSEVISGVVRDVLDPAKYTPTGELKNITGELAAEHNTATNNMINDTTDIDTEVKVPTEKPAYDTPELRSVKSARDYQASVQRKVDALPAGPNKVVRQELVNFSGKCLDASEAAYRAGDNTKGDIVRELAIIALDIGLSLTPGVGFAKDIYEFSTGVNLLTGAKLTTFERTMSAVGILTAGYGSKLAILGKAGALIDIVKVGSKDAEAVAAATRAVTKAEEIAVAAEKIGVKDRKIIDEIADIVKDGMPCKVASLSPLDRIFGLIIDTAYAADCIPGAVEDTVVNILNDADKVPGLTSDVGSIEKYAEASAKYGRNADEVADSLKSGKGLYGNLPEIPKSALNEKQAANFTRFEKKLPAGAEPVTIHSDNAVIFKGEVPGNVPGSKAVYEKVVNEAGETTIYTKTTYKPNGKVVHIKDKIDDSVIRWDD